eukprot:gene13632-18293_t
MNFNLLRRFSDSILYQLFCDWLTIIDISLLDQAFLCWYDSSRQQLIRIISDSSMLSPIYSEDSQFSAQFWSWLSNRKFFIKHLVLYSIEDNIKIFDEMVHNLSSDCDTRDVQITKEKLFTDELKNSAYNIVALAKVKYLGFKNFSDKIYSINSTLINLSKHCKNLTSLELGRCYDVNETGLLAILESNVEVLTELSLLEFTELEGIEINQELLLNIKTLELRLNDWNENMLKSMSVRLKSLRSLTVETVSLTTWRSSLPNLLQLEYLTISLQLDTENDNLQELFPQSLIELSFTWDLEDFSNYDFFNNYTNTINKKKRKQNLISFHLLENLQHLSIKNSCLNESSDGDNSDYTPTLPSGLITLDLSEYAVKLSSENLVQMLSMKKFINLVKLDLSNQDRISGVGLQGLLPPSLEYLDLRFCRSITNEGFLDILSNDIPNLTFLNLSHCLFLESRRHPFLPLPRSLLTLTLSQMPHLSMKNLAILFSSFLSNLTYLNLSGLSNLKGEELYGLLSTNLTYLNLNGCASLTNQGLLSILSNNFSNLTSLNIGNLPLISNETFSNLLIPVSLTYLRMNRCVNLYDSGIIAMLLNNNLLNLKIMNLCNNYNIHCEGIVERLPQNLTFVDFCGCAISTKGIIEIDSFKLLKPELKIKTKSEFEFP